MPHSEQNRAVGASEVPHFGQRRDRGAPQFWQNLASLPFGCPHCVQVISYSPWCCPIFTTPAGWWWPRASTGAAMTRLARAGAETGSRVASLDVLRGVGILGILLVHIQSFSSVRAVFANPRVYGDLSGWNWWVWLGTYLLADGKFIAIFAMLFGAGLVVLADRHEGLGRSAAGLHYRRM